MSEYSLNLKEIFSTDELTEGNRQVEREKELFIKLMRLSELDIVLIVNELLYLDNGQPAFTICVILSFSPVLSISILPKRPSTD